MTTPLTAAEFAQAFGLTPVAAAPASPPPQFVAYITAPEDRWDLIAWRVYGDATLISGIIAANPRVAISPVLTQGVTIYCPLIAPPAPPAGTLPWS